jgi:hypothetical protein
MTLHACNNQSHFTVNLRNYPKWIDMERLGPALRPAYWRCQAGTIDWQSIVGTQEQKHPDR